MISSMLLELENFNEFGFYSQEIQKDSNVLHLTFYIRYVYVKLIMKSKMTPYDYRKIIMMLYILVNLINVFERKTIF